MTGRIRERLPSLRDERGFTLIELIMASAVGILILGSATLITIGAARHNGEVANRTDATQRGRLAMERMERLLRSQVCTTASPFPVAAASPTSVTFYADLSDGSSPVIRHTFTYDPASRRLDDQLVRGTATSTGVAFASPPIADELATNVDRDGTNPVFRYYGYPATPPATGRLEPDVELTPSGGSLTATQLGQIARIDLNFVTTGATKSTADIRAEMTNQVFVRLADPNDTSSFNPSCT